MASEGDKFIYFLLGGFVGASVALLLAPRSGEDTRKFLEDKYKEGTDLLGQKAQEGRDFVSEKSRDVADRVAGGLDQGKETFSRQREQVVAAIEAGKEAYEEEKHKLERPRKRKKSAS